jgi:hypothetical protein
MNNYYYYDSYDFNDLFTPGYGAGILSALLVVLVVLYLVLIAYAILSYVLSSLGFYTMAKRRGIRNYGLAWVPIANYWIIGSLADQYDLAVKGKETGYRRKLLIWGIVYVCLTFLFCIVCGILGTFTVLSDGSFNYVVSGGIFFFLFLLLMLAIAITTCVFYYIALYKVFNSCNPNTSTTFLVLSIVLSVTFPFFVFADRNKDLGFPAPSPAPTAPNPYAAPYPAQPVQPLAQPIDTAAPAKTVPVETAPADIPADEVDASDNVQDETVENASDSNDGAVDDTLDADDDKSNT